MAITGPQFQAHAPPVVQAQVLQKPGNVYNGMFAQLLGNTLGTGFEHLMRGFFPTPQDEVALAQANSWKNQNLKAVEGDLAMYKANEEEAIRQGKTTDAGHWRQLYETSAKQAGLDPSLVASNDQTRMTATESTMRNQAAVMDQREGQALLDKYKQQPVQPVQPGSNVAPEPARDPGGMVSNPYDFQQPQQQMSQQSPEVQKMQNVADGFHNPSAQPMNFTQEDRLKFNSAMTRLQTNSQMMKYLNKNQADQITPEMRDLASQGVDAFSEIARMRWEKEGVQPEWTGLLTGDLLMKGVQAYRAFASGKDPEGKQVKAFDDLLTYTANTSPSALANPNAVARFRTETLKMVMQSAPGLVNMLNLDKTAAEIPQIQANTENIKANTQLTAVQMDAVRQNIATQKLAGQLTEKQIASWDATQDADRNLKLAQVGLLTQQAGLALSQAEQARLAVQWVDAEKSSEVLANMTRAISNLTNDPELNRLIQMNAGLGVAYDKLTVNTYKRSEDVKTYQARYAQSGSAEDKKLLDDATRLYTQAAAAEAQLNMNWSAASQLVNDRMSQGGAAAQPLVAKMQGFLNNFPMIVDPTTGHMKPKPVQRTATGAPITMDTQDVLQKMASKMPTGMNYNSWLNSKINGVPVTTYWMNQGYKKEDMPSLWQQLQAAMAKGTK